MCIVFMFCFFFFKQKTAYEMRISDWSSDVCSSDLMSTHWAIALACLAASPAFASPTLDGIFGDHAVLQRGQPIVLAGAAEPSEEITIRSEEHTSELQSLMRISYAVFCLKKKNNNNLTHIKSVLTVHSTTHHILLYDRT